MSSTTDLKERLEQYGATAGGQLAKARCVGELAGYAAAVGAGLAIAGAADASIIYSGVQNISVHIDPAATATNTTVFRQDTFNSSIDLNGDGTNDIRIGAHFFGAHPYPPISLNSAKYAGLASVGGLNGFAFAGASSAVLQFAASDATIGPDMNFGTDAVARGKQQSVSVNGASVSSTFFDFPIGASEFLGIKLGSGHYGWIRLRLDDLGLNQPFSTLLGGPLGDGQGYPDKVTVIDWAYENTGAPIHVGSTPEPSTLALLAAGAAGLGAFRRRKAQRLAR